MTESLVLTEDDYLEFLVGISRDLHDIVPRRVAQALTGSSLLFIGYRLADWDLRVILHGLVNAMEKDLRRINVSVQLPPDLPAAARKEAINYLKLYFAKIDVRVFWGTAREFARELRRRWPERGEQTVKAAG